MSAATAPTAERRGEPLLEMRDVRVAYPSEHGAREVLAGFDLVVREREIVCIVGESGSGKSQACLAALGLLPRHARVSAQRLAYAGRDLLALSERERAALRGAEMAIVFQDPLSALNPYLSIGEQLEEALPAEPRLSRDARRDRCAAALAQVGLSEARERLRSHPHQLSGGMRQRVLIAMALLARPRLLFADEPTTALDVTLQAQILELLLELQRDRGMALVFVTHSLGVAARIAERIAVVYAGRVVEDAPAGALFDEPLHPYTRALLECVPRLDRPRVERLPSIAGVPNARRGAAESCSYAARCAHADERCRRELPYAQPLEATGALADLAAAAERVVACHEARALALARRGRGSRPTLSLRDAERSDRA
jgi:peptide/nickel transport system ATP-binding protein